jgi:tRNA(Ile)-lysidine synthase TilS/MesJ
MNPVGKGASKDAVFMSPHKFIGGPGTPGILVVKKKLLRNVVPSVPGGGTVFFVSTNSQTYLENIEEREEGGTQDIIGSIRAGLVFHVREMVSTKTISDRESAFLNRAWDKWSSHPNILMLGHSPVVCNRLAIISFLIKHKSRYLHWNYVAALLNDLFGIQVRGGCVCAGPYAINLLGISPANVELFEREMLEKDELIRPGFVRLSFPYFLTERELSFVIKAVDWVATNGWKLLPQYLFYPESGEFKHRTVGVKKPYRRWLQSAVLQEDGSLKSNGSRTQPTSSSLQGKSEAAMELIYNSYLADAQRAVDDAVDSAHRAVPRTVSYGDTLSERAKELRWFILPDDAAKDLACLLSLVDADEDDECTSIAPKRLYIASVESNSNSNTASPARNKIEGSHDSPLGTISSESSLPTSPSPPLDAVSSPPEKNTSKKPSAGSNGASAPPVEGLKKKFKIELSNPPTAEDSCSISASVSRMIEPGSDVSSGVEYKYSKCLSTGNLEYTAFVHRAKAVPGSQLKAPLKNTKDKKMFPDVSKKLLYNVGNAIRDFQMIKDGDRLLLGLSGGKDSLAMLHTLLHFQRVAPVKFEIACVTIDPQASGFDPSPLRAYCNSLGVPYFYESAAIVPRALVHMTGPKQSICSWCSRMKRGILYACARREKYNVLVLAQHLDDLAESFIMSSFYNGSLRTMKAHYTCAAGDVRIIRPFVYARERLTREFSHTAKLPIIIENCPACFEGPKERYRIKTLLASQEILFPDLFQSLSKAMMPIMNIRTANSGDGDDDDEGEATLTAAQLGAVDSAAPSSSSSKATDAKEEKSGSQSSSVPSSLVSQLSSYLVPSIVANYVGGENITLVVTTSLSLLGGMLIGYSLRSRS